MNRFRSSGSRNRNSQQNRSKANAKANTTKASSNLKVEALESRILYSAAPAPEPAEAPAAFEAAPEPAPAAATAAATPAVQETQQAVAPTTVPVPEGDTNISGDLEVTLVEVNGTAPPLTQEAGQATAEALHFQSSATEVSLTLSLDGEGNLQILGEAGVLLTRELASISELTITGNDLDNTLFVDFANGNPIPGGGLTYDGVNRGTDYDILEFVNTEAAPINTLVSDAVNGHDGDLILTSANGQTSLVHYRNIEPVIMTAGTVADLTVNFIGGFDDVVILEDNGVLGDGLSRLRSTSGTAETFTFLNPTNSLTICQ